MSEQDQIGSHAVPDSVAWLRRVWQQIQPGLKAAPELPDQFEAAWDVVAASCGMSAWDLAREIARQHGLRSTALPAELTSEALVWMRLPMARECGAALVQHEEGYLVVAVADPTTPELTERLRFESGMPVELVIAPPADIRRLRNEMPTEPGGDDEEADAKDIAEGGGKFYVMDLSSESAVVRLCNMMLRQALVRSASDIHVQPMGGSGLVRMRIDGLLQKAGRLPLNVMTRLISRVKAVAGMDPTDRMHPQDGRASMVGPGRTLDLRIATLPVTGGEKLVVRLLGGHSILRLTDLDLPDLERRQIKDLVGSTMGVVVVAGPTGSGKTTTLYSMLAEKNTPDVNIVTVEDPVEIRMPMLAQTEVNPRANLTFATALRSVVRQDPDVILIGEIRDGETATIAMQAAITGHMVLASVHANDAVSVLPRLAELGVDAELVAEAVRGVVSQRLVRRVCSKCAQPAAEPWTPIEAWLNTHAGLAGAVRAVGCADCGFTGYKGRCAILQVLVVTPDVAYLLDHEAPLSEVRAAARKQGMRFLGESAMDRILRRQTTLEEVLREMGTDFWRGAEVALGAKPPAGLGHSVAAPQQADDRGAVLLMAKDDAWRKQLAGWLAALEWRVVNAATEGDVRDAMTHDMDFALAIIDVTGFKEDRARALLGMRSVLGVALVPIMYIAGESHRAFDEHVLRQAHTLLVPAPATMEQLHQQVSRALVC